MPQSCAICGQTAQAGMNLSHAHNRTHRRWQPNLQPARIRQHGRVSRVLVCTRCLRSGRVLKAG